MSNYKQINEDCENCNGTGVVPKDHYEHVDIGNVRLGKILLDKIKDLPDIMLGPVDSEKEPVGFKGDTIEKAETRMKEAFQSGFLPMAMLYRDNKGDRNDKFMKWSRQYARAAIAGSAKIKLSF